MRAAIDPKAVADQHRARIAPLLEVFSVTHSRVAVLSLLFQSWGRSRGMELQVEALTGPLLVGADELEDEKKLREWQPIFARLFGAGVLPPELQADAVKRQRVGKGPPARPLPVRRRRGASPTGLRTRSNKRCSRPKEGAGRARSGVGAQGQRSVCRAATHCAPLAGEEGRAALLRGPARVGE